MRLRAARPLQLPKSPATAAATATSAAAAALSLASPVSATIAAVLQTPVPAADAQPLPPRPDVASARLPPEHPAVPAAQQLVSAQQLQPGTPKQWLCDECGKVFPTSSRFHKHKKLHTPLRPFRCTVTGCDAAFKRKVHLDRHLNNHQPQKAFSCNFQGCTKSFATAQKLAKHRAAHERLRCQVCGKGFRKPAKLVHHMREHAASSSSGGTALTCDVCGLAFKSAELLQRHAKRHRSHACDQCGQSFLHFRELVVHRRSQHPKLAVCDECGKAYRREEALREHQRRVHAEAVLVCPEPGCGCTFSRAGNLHMHRCVAHQGIRRFACNLCSMTFAYKHVLKRHRQRLHPGRSPQRMPDQQALPALGGAELSGDAMDDASGGAATVHQNQDQHPPPPLPHHVPRPQRKRGLQPAVIGVGLGLPAKRTRAGQRDGELQFEPCV